MVFRYFSIINIIWSHWFFYPLFYSDSLYTWLAHCILSLQRILAHLLRKWNLCYNLCILSFYLAYFIMLPMTRWLQKKFSRYYSLDIFEEWQAGHSIWSTGNPLNLFPQSLHIHSYSITSLKIFISYSSLAPFIFYSLSGFYNKSFNPCAAV